MNDPGEPRLIDDATMPVIYCDGPARVLIEGSNVRILFFEYRRIDGERVRLGVLEMVRPLASIQMGNILGMIAEAKSDTEGIATAH